jgi:hypothetical protein
MQLLSPMFQTEYMPYVLYKLAPPFSVSIHRDKMYVSTTKLTGGPLG